MKQFYPLLAKQRASRHINGNIQSRARHENFPLMVLLYLELETVPRSVDAATLGVFGHFPLFFSGLYVGVEGKKWW